ncbi:hypothetical protein XELAEV_18031425mg [Xenopus laevis]|uniref:Uncharacterized protein n=1 Tax=Xenopus laevis TaxID=8355 RepID=A0A974CMQ4_XENLA|nr:hypothetical protein XELAEV_18031425mg [Xenopus laevis]
MADNIHTSGVVGAAVSMDRGLETSQTETAEGNDTMDQTDISMQSLFKQLQKVSIKEIKLWWEITTLQNYIKIKRVPRGLRIKKFPAFEVQDKDLMTEWYEALTDSSLKLMGILVTKYQTQQGRLEVEISQLEVTLNAYKDTPDYDKMNKRIVDDLSILERKIMDTKQKKFLRDKADYEQESVFSWGMKLNTQRGRWERLRPALKIDRGRRQNDRSNNVSCDEYDSVSPSVSFLVTSASDLDVSQDDEQGEMEYNMKRKKKTRREEREAQGEELTDGKRETRSKKGREKGSIKNR